MPVDLDVSFDQVTCVERNLCHPGGFFPVGQWRTLVIAPSVFTSQIKRRLTNKKLHECWDESYRMSQEADNTPGRWDFNPRWVPAKILVAFIACLQQRGESGANGQAMQLFSTAGSLPIARHRALSDESHLEENHLFQELAPRLRPAKNDDAAIPYHFWDIPFWSFFVILDRSKEFMVGAAEAKIGTNSRLILDVLRDFLLRVWRRSVFRSF
jgi:hypothetical protein